MNSAPILFCHYGHCDYLEYTLKYAKFFNPEKRIILIGDEFNLKIAQKASVEHYHFNNFNDSAELASFNKVYVHVAGKNHGREFWTNFVFKRWFYIHEFIKQNNITSFWHFDSDNLIVTNLEKQENKFKDYDCTEQCGGICMNGYISNFKVLNGYVHKIIELFQNQEYLNQQRADMVPNPDFAFTEMRAYRTYKQEEGIKSIRLNEIIDGETFDDCICHADGMETYSYAIDGRILKKIYYTDNGDLFCKYLQNGTMIKMNSFNMSWVPSYLYPIIFNKAKQKKNNLPRLIKDYKTIDLKAYNLNKAKKTAMQFLLKVRYSSLGDKTFTLLKNTLKSFK